jgi:ATP-dependent DNA helicase RecG
MNDQIREAIEAVLSGRQARELESERLDFKTLGRSREDTLINLAEAAACLANSRGGDIVVGIADAPRGTSAIVGSDLDELRTQRRIYEVTVPGLIVTVTTEVVTGTRLTVVSVPRSPDIHQVKGRATERVGASCEPMTAQRIAAVLADRRGDDWSDGDSGVALSEIAGRAEDELRNRLRTAPDPERQAWATLSVVEIARRLGLLTAARTLTYAGEVLLVGRPGSEIHYIHRRTRSGQLTANERLTGPALVAVRRLLEFVETRTDRTPVHLPNGQQLFVADLPEIAVREAVVNAVMHRDYQAAGPVQVEHSDTRLAVTSPGDFVLGVTPQNILTTSSRTRNPALASVVRALGLAEAAGVGVDRMYAAMTAVGHRPPTFETDGVRVTATLFGGAPNAPLTRFVASMDAARRDDPDTLLILVTLLRSRTVTAERLAPLLQKGADEVETTLRHLAAQSVAMVERTRASSTHRMGTYRLRGDVIAALATAVTYHQRTGDEADRKVIDIVRETAQVNGRLVRSLLDVDAPTASRIIAGLIERGVLVKTSEAQRGPSVTYGRGPAFPNRTATTPRRPPKETDS